MPRLPAQNLELSAPRSVCGSGAPLTPCILHRDALGEFWRETEQTAAQRQHRGRLRDGHPRVAPATAQAPRARGVLNEIKESSAKILNEL